MKTLFLGSIACPTFLFLRDCEKEVVQKEDKLTPDYIRQNKIDFIVSHGYRHIIKPDIIQMMSERIINLHISFLPFNRGADPNLWSFLESTPSGISIHKVDEGLDTGAIYIQKELYFDDSHTLSSSYAILQREIVELFVQNWDAIKNGNLKAVPQKGKGTFHYLKDKEPYLFLLKERGWDTPVKLIRGKATKKGLS
jgi:methionyl-tRNA formyltransferase